MRAITARMLREAGHAVVEAADPALALGATAASTAPCDVLVTDIVMPGMSGRALAEALTARHPGIGVVYMSAYAPETVFGDRMLPEGTPYLRKPFDRAELVSRVASVLEGRATEG